VIFWGAVALLAIALLSVGLITRDDGVIIDNPHNLHPLTTTTPGTRAP